LYRMQPIARRRLIGKAQRIGNVASHEFSKGGAGSQRLGETGARNAHALSRNLRNYGRGTEIQPEKNGQPDHPFVANTRRMDRLAVLHEDHQADGSRTGKINVRNGTSLPVNFKAMRQRHGLPATQKSVMFFLGKAIKQEIPRPIRFRR
jgi:hypothetical protein